MGQIKRIN